MIRSHRAVLFLLALMVVAAPAHAEGDGESDDDETGSTGSQDTSGNSTSAPHDEATGTAKSIADHGTSQVILLAAGDAPPCGIVYWHQNEPTRIIVDPNNCFTPIIYDLLTGT